MKTMNYTLSIAIVYFVTCNVLISMGKYCLDNSCRLEKGHLEPFGHHRAPDQTVEILNYMIAPEDFYMNYVLKHKPVVIKDAVKRWPAYQLWSDEYLSENYGDISFNMETKDDDKQNIPNSMSMKDFLKVYKTADRYLVDEVHAEMRKDIILPLCLRCEEMDQYFFVSYFWFSQGNTSSKIHIDTDENMLCVIKGHKTILLISPEYSHDLYADTSMVLGVSDINVNRVDLIKYPKVKNVRYIIANVEEGDMIYIPQMWWHHVYSKPGRQQAVALWWKSKPWLTKEGRKSHLFENEPTTKHKYSYASILEQYEQWVQDMSDIQHSELVCNEQKVQMSEYQFESDKNPGSIMQTSGDGGDMEEDNPEQYKEVYRRSILSGKKPDGFFTCHFDRSNLKCPCYYKPCQSDDGDESLPCIRYILDYCHMFKDRGCIIMLPHLLTKVNRDNYALIQQMSTDFSY